MITTLERRGRRLAVNGRIVEVYGDHTWDLWPDVNRVEAWKDHKLEEGSVQQTADRSWWGWDHYGPSEWERLVDYAEWCAENDVVNVVMVFQRYTWGGGAWDDPERLEQRHKIELSRVMLSLSGIPYILEIGNELSYPGFMREATAFAKSMDPDQLVAVNTGRNGPVNQLEDIGADVVFATPGYEPSSRQVIVGWDSDHMSKTTLHGDKISSLEYWYEQKKASGYHAKIMLMMRAWDGSKLINYTKPVNDPDNPAFGRALVWMEREVGDQIGDPVEPPAPPPPGPPPPGGVVRYDMLDFFRQSMIGENERLRNMSVSIVGNRIFLVKDSTGSAKDTLVFNDREIKRIATEHHEHRGKPTAFKGQYGMDPLTEMVCPRYLEFDPDQEPGKLWSTHMPDTTYRLWVDCQVERIGNVGFGVASVWGPYRAGKPGLEDWREPIGGIIPDDTLCLAIVWYWGGPSPVAAPNKEEFINALGFGPVDWNHYLWSPGGYGEPFRSTLNKNVIRAPKIAPLFPCDKRLLDPSYTYPI